MNNIKRVVMGTSNSYLVRGNNGFVLIDAGMQGKSNNVKRALRKLNASISDIQLIIVTHVHHDHVGSLHDIKKESNAQVLVHKNEVVNLARGFTSFPQGTMGFSKIVSNIANKHFLSVGRFTPVGADVVIEDRYSLVNYGINGEVIFTPGHTEGSICVILEDKYCFSGDTLFNIFPNSVFPPYAENKEMLIESWKRIDSYECIKFYPGHGREFDNTKFTATLQNYTK